MRRAAVEGLGTAALVAVVVGSGIQAAELTRDAGTQLWQLDDPAGQGVEAVRPIRDEIERRIRPLLAELGVEAAV